MIELLYLDGCPSAETFVAQLRELMAQVGVTEPIQMRRVESADDAARARFLGSPTLRVDGRDVDPGAIGRDDFGLKCRIYHTADGIARAPAREWVLDALRSAAA
jgi:hypothetical protein